MFDNLVLSLADPRVDTGSSATVGLETGVVSSWLLWATLEDAELGPVTLFLIMSSRETSSLS